MATISSVGISGSGLDETVITKLMAVERLPITQLTKKTDGLKTQLSAFGKVQSALATLRDAASKLTKPDTWGGALSTSSDASAVSVSASSSAQLGTYSVSVSQLASAQTLAGTTRYTSSSAPVGEGSLTIQLGSWGSDGGGNATFTDKAQTSAVTINIDSSNNTLGGLRDAINAAGAGVSASIVNDSSGSRLVLRSTESGESNGFTVAAQGGLADLGYDPRVGVTAMIQTLPAQNARALINGVDISSESNLLKEAIDGINITLLKTTTVPASIAVSQDKDSIKKIISDFTAAYNAVNSLLREQTKYDPDSKTAGNLQGDSTAIAIQNQLRSIVGGTTTLSSTGRLAEIGIAAGLDGNLVTTDTKLNSALGDLGSLKTLFMGVDSGGNSSNDGFAQRLRSYVDSALSTDGRLSNRQTGLQKLISNNDKRSSEIEDRVSLTEARLRARYTALDKQMSQLSGLSSYVTQQLEMLNKG